MFVNKNSTKFFNSKNLQYLHNKKQLHASLPIEIRQSLHSNCKICKEKLQTIFFCWEEVVIFMKVSRQRTEQCGYTVVQNTTYGKPDLV